MPVRIRPLAGWLLAGALAATGPVPAAAAVVPAVVPELYDLTLRLDDDHFEGELTLSARAAAATALVTLDAEDLDVLGLDVRAPGGKLAVDEWWTADGRLWIRLSRPLVPGERLRLRFTYRGGYQPTGGEGLVRTVDEGRIVFSTQLQPAAARRVFPGVDHPCCPARFALRVIAPAGHAVFANAPIASRVRRGGEVVTRFETTARIAPYLLALVAGDVEATPAGSHRSITGPPRPLRVIAPAGAPVPAETLGAMVERLITAFERWLGLELPSPKLDVALVPGFRYYGMENPGLLVLRSEIVAWAEREDRWHDLEELVAHELAHQWLGNELAPARWRDIWISESFATWAAASVTAAGADAETLVERLSSLVEAERGFRPPIVPADAVLESHPAAIFVSARYGAGALLLEDLFEGVEEEGRVLGTALRAGRGTPQTTEQLLGLLADAGVDPVRLAALARALHDRRPPLLEIEPRCRPHRSAVAVRWVRGRSPARRVCLDLHGSGPPAVACTADQGAERVLPLATCPELAMPRLETLGYANWVFADPGDYHDALERAETLDERDRLSLLSSLLVAVWTERFAADSAAELIGREMATSTSASGDALRRLVIDSISVLDGGAGENDPGRRLLGSWLSTVGGCAQLAAALEGREELTSSVGRLARAHQLCGDQLAQPQPPARSPEELLRLAARRGSYDRAAWAELLATLPGLPARNLLWLLEAPERWPWEGREASDLLEALVDSGSPIWEQLEPARFDRFLREVVPERRWDDVAGALGRTCSRATLDLVAATETFVEPGLLEQRETALLAIGDCLRVRAAQAAWYSGDLAPGRRGAAPTW